MLSRIVIFIVIIIVILFVTSIIVYFLILKKTPDKNNIAKTNKQQWIRKVDLIKLSKEEEEQKNYAYKLIEKKRYLEGAKILEQLNLHRYAVSVLEDNGHINEACAILISMDRPSRAAAIYARNKMYVKAAELYLIAKTYEESANCYMLAGQKDVKYYTKAGEIYEKNLQIEKALGAYICGQNIIPAITIIFRLKAFGKLENLLNNKNNIIEAFNYLDKEEVQIIISEMPMKEEIAILFAVWVNESKRMDLAGFCLQRLAFSDVLLLKYWQALDIKNIEEIVNNLIYILKNKETKNNIKTFVSKSAKILFDTKNFLYSAKLYEAMERYLMVAKCYILMNNISETIKNINLSNDDIIISSLNSILEKYKNNYLNNEDFFIILNRLLEEINSDRDEHHNNSPFSLAS